VTLPRLDHKQLKKILPQAYPFLLIDYVEEYKLGENLTAIKNLTVNEWPFKGKMPVSNAYPESLLIESAAQAALVLYHVSKVGERLLRPLLVIGKVVADFQKTIEFGDTIKINVHSGKMLSTGGFANVQITVDQEARAVVQVFYGVMNPAKGRNV